MVVRYALLLSCVLLFATAAVGQGPPVDEANTTLYVWNGDSLFMSTDPADDRNTANIEAGDGGAAVADGDHAWIVPFRDGLAHPVLLGGDVEFTARLGGATGAGTFDLVFRLLHGSNVVAQATGEVTYTGGYQVVTGSAPVQVERLAPGEDLTWEITAKGTGVQFFLGTDGTSFLTLPVVGVELPEASPGPGVVYENRTGDTLDLRIEAANATDGVHVVNWTTTAQAFVLNINATVSNGSVHVLILRDASPLINQTVTTNETITSVIDAAAGNWTLEIMQEGFVGTLQITAAAYVDANETTQPHEELQHDETEPADKGAPLPWVVGVAALAVAVGRRRG